jgi:hypothetical protein
MHCKHPLTRSLAALLLLGAASCAQAKEHEGWVYNGLSGWGSASLEGLDDSSFSSNPTIGYRWGNIGVEAGYGWFGDFEEKFENGTHHIDTEATLRGFNVGANFNHDFGGKWSLQGRAGVFLWNVDGSFDDSLLSSVVDFDDDGTDWYAGGSITYQTTKRSSLGLGYTHFAAGDADIDLWGLSTEFRF